MDPSNSPSVIRRPRGRYRLYLDPTSGRQFVPESTRRRHNKRRNECLQVPPSEEPTEPRVENENPDDSMEEQPDSIEEQPDSMVVEAEIGRVTVATPASCSGAPSPSTASIAQDNLASLNIEDLVTGFSVESVQPDITDASSTEVPLREDRESAANGSVESDTRKQRQSFATNHDLDTPLMFGLKTTKIEAYLMVLHVVVRHGNTGALTLDLIRFANALLGENVLNPSLYIFSKLFSSHIKSDFHFYCPECLSYIAEKSTFQQNELTADCPSCDHECNVSDTYEDNVFISLPIKEQLEDLISRPDVCLLRNEERVNSSEIRDVMDGELYKRLLLSCEAANRKFFTVTVNTDGVSPYDSAPGSLYPIWLYVNELVPEQRLRPENLILAGLWYGKKAPNMSTFFRPFAEEFQDLSSDGVSCRKSNVNGKDEKFSVYPILCSVDSVAKPKVQRHKQFNGNYACGFCEHPNCEVIGSENVRGYHTGKLYPLRTHESLSSNMIAAHNLDLEGKLKKTKSTDDSVCGSLGLSPLLALEYFDVVWGFPIDYMHNCLEGVMALLVRIWTDGQYSDKDFYLSPNVLKNVNERLVSITPPQPFRSTRSLDERAQWKAWEWYSFLLFFGLPCLEGFLPGRYFEHFAKFVEAIFLLLQESISRADLERADNLLQEFVSCFPVLYSNEHMVYNLHILTHLAKVVYYCGPLWAFSNFVFESGNGQLMRFLKGTRSVIQEICKKYILMQTVSECCDLWSVQDHVSDFCENVLTFGCTKGRVKCSDGISLPGRPTLTSISDEEHDCLKSYNTDFPVGKILFYQRAIKNGVLYYSRDYMKPTKKDDTCVLLRDKTYVIIDKILRFPDDKTYAIVTPIRLSERVVDYLAPHIQTCAYDCFKPKQVIPFETVAKKCVFLCVNGRKYVCDLPNSFERN